MNIRHLLHDIPFEWDDDKAVLNIRKHGVPFETACEVLFDPFITVVKNEPFPGELRQSAIGVTSNWELLYVVYVLRDDRIRLISARPATRQERRRYEDE